MKFKITKIIFRNHKHAVSHMQDKHILYDHDFPMAGRRWVGEEHTAEYNPLSVYRFEW